MLKVLMKKQLTEVFRSYFYDAKKNKMRSKGAIVCWFVFFFVIMIGMLGGMFTFLSLSLCDPLAQVGMGWLYFLLMGVLSIFLGAFGSVFNTYSSLYLAKDNDLLLSLPIPVRTIMTARLMNVYLMGSMYSATVLIPALIVYWIVAGATAARVICGLMLFVTVTLIVMLLSCLLGWAVARISLKLKNKSFITVLVALVFIGAYYYFYFQATEIIRDLIQNAEIYGEQIKGAAYVLYLFGRIGEGDWLAMALCLGVTAVLCGLVWIGMSRNFVSIATATGSSKKARYVEKTAREKTAFGALFGKELARFTSSPNYMLNCGLSVLLIPVCGVLLLIKGREVCEALDRVFAAIPDATAVLVCAALCMLASMNDMAAPSVSLEGKCLWIPQSLPVAPKTALHAKGAVQLVLTGVPMLFAAVCAAVTVPASPAAKVFLCVTPLIYTVFSSLFGLFMGVRIPLLNWTDEVAPIKQSGAVSIVMFSGWGFSFALGGLYLLLGQHISAPLYLGLWTVLFAAGSVLLLRWLNGKGSRIFAELS